MQTATNDPLLLFIQWQLNVEKIRAQTALRAGACPNSIGRTIILNEGFNEVIHVTNELTYSLREISERNPSHQYYIALNFC